MSTDLATRTDDDLASMLGLNLRDPKTRAMIAVCQQYEFDPLLKHVVVIPQGGVYITRDGLLHVAHRSGQLDGIVIESGPDLVDGEWRCVVSVYRKDMGRPFTFPGRYSASGGNKKYAPEMAIKVAESMALRRAFDVSGLGIVDELQPDDEPPARRPERASAPQVDDPWANAVDVTDAEIVEDDHAPTQTYDDVRTALGVPRPTGDDERASDKQKGMIRGLLRNPALALDPGNYGHAVNARIGRIVADLNGISKVEASALITKLTEEVAAKSAPTVDAES
jgi:hypothetical protein